MKLNKIIILMILGLILLLVLTGDISHILSIENINSLNIWINQFGLLTPVVYIALYVLSTLLFLPAIPITLLGGLLFGPLLGTLYVSIASTSGAVLSFMIARYLGRDYVESKLGSLDLFKKIDDGVNEQAWKTVAITRLVPLFPFNAQNYVYGLTSVSLKTYTFVSWICMLPATFAYVSLSGSITAGQGNIMKTVTYIGIAVAIILLMSLLSKAIMKKQKLS